MPPIATAVLVTITGDGHVEHLGLPPAVAALVVAEERARRAGEEDADGLRHAGTGEDIGRHGSVAPGSAQRCEGTNFRSQPCEGFLP